METAELGIVAAELMELLERDYLGKENVKLGVVAVIAEIEFTEDEEEFTAIQYRCSDPRKWVQSGFFSQASRAVRNEDDDDE